RLDHATRGSRDDRGAEEPDRQGDDRCAPSRRQDELVGAVRAGRRALRRPEHFAYSIDAKIASCSERRGGRALARKSSRPEGGGFAWRRRVKARRGRGEAVRDVGTAPCDGGHGWGCRVKTSSPEPRAGRSRATAAPRPPDRVPTAARRAAPDGLRNGDNEAADISARTNSESAGTDAATRNPSSKKALACPC